MKQTGLVRGREEGSVLVYSVVVLLLLTVVGLLASRTAVYELNLSGNDRTIHEMKLTADSVTVVAAQLFDLLPNDVCQNSDWTSTTRLSWYSRGTNDLLDTIANDVVLKNDMAENFSQDIRNWNGLNSAVLLDEQTGLVPAGFPNCRYQVIDMGPAPLESLTLENDETRLHSLLISGLHQRGQKRCIVQIGYRRRF